MPLTVTHHPDLLHRDIHRQCWRVGGQTVWGVQGGEDSPGRHLPPVLVLHGLGSDIDEYQPLFTTLGQHRRFLAYDHPGFGPHAHDVEAVSVEEMADVAAGVIQQIAGEPVDLMGASMGGLVSLCLMARFPYLVRKGVLMAPAGSTTHRPTQARALAFLARQMDLPVAQGAWLLTMLKLSQDNIPEPFTRWQWLRRFSRRRCRTDFGAQGANFLSAASAVLASGKGADWAAQVQCPVLILQGTADTIVPVASSEQYLRVIPGARMEILQGGFHSMPILHPQWVLETALPWLAS